MELLLLLLLLLHIIIVISITFWKALHRRTRRPNTTMDTENEKYRIASCSSGAAAAAAADDIAGSATSIVCA